MIRLYDYPLSGSCYKVRLLLSFLNIDYESVPIDFFPGREHRGDAFLEINPLGQIPVLEDEGLRFRDAQAILVYLAAKYDPHRSWYPTAPAAMGLVSMWLAFAGEEIMNASAARMHDMLGYELDAVAARARAERAFRILDDHLADGECEGRGWVAVSEPTIADIACFPYVALAPEANIELSHYPAIWRWIFRIKALPRFVPMPGIFA